MSDSKTWNDMHCIRSIFLSFVSIGIAFGDDSGNDNDFSYPFKDRIHSMVAGHHHLDGIELKEICNLFSEHFSDILELQSEPPEFQTERYINNLTALVILSDTLTREQKYTFYRRSYDQALEARKNGDEWKWLFGLLVERTDALSLPELRDLMKNTTDEPRKRLIEEAIDRIERRSKVRIRRSEQDANQHLALEAGNEEGQASPDQVHDHLSRIVAGVVLLGIIVLLLKAMRSRGRK